MENESLSAQIVTLKLINTKFKARIAELEAQLEEEKQRTFVQYERAVGFSALNATLEARLKEAEASRDKLWREQHTIIVRAEGYLISIDRLTERAEKAEADAVRLREALRKVEWVSGWDVEGHKAIYCPWCNRIKGFGHTFDCVRQAALSPAATAEQPTEKEDCPGCGRPSLSELPGVFKEGEGPCKHCGWTDDAEQPAPRDVSGEVE